MMFLEDIQLMKNHFSVYSIIQTINKECKRDRGVLYGRVSLLFYPFFNFIFIFGTITHIPTSSHLCPPPPSPHPSFPMAITTLLSMSMGYVYMFFG